MGSQERLDGPLSKTWRPSGSRESGVWVFLTFWGLRFRVLYGFQGCLKGLGCLAFGICTLGLFRAVGLSVEASWFRVRGLQFKFRRNPKHQAVW